MCMLKPFPAVKAGSNIRGGRRAWHFCAREAHGIDRSTRVNQGHRRGIARQAHAASTRRLVAAPFDGQKRRARAAAQESGPKYLQAISGVMSSLCVKCGNRRARLRRSAAEHHHWPRRAMPKLKRRAERRSINCARRNDGAEPAKSRQRLSASRRRARDDCCASP